MYRKLCLNMLQSRFHFLISISCLEIKMNFLEMFKNISRTKPLCLVGFLYKVKVDQNDVNNCFYATSGFVEIISLIIIII